MQANHDPKPLKRVNYFTGKLLTVEDFQAEQNYFRDKHRLHNRYLHGSGVVFGLEVSIENNLIHIAPGLALDCSGEEILLPAPFESTPPDGAKAVFLMIYYAEHPIGSVPVPGTGDEPPQPAFVEEGFDLTYQADDPYFGHGEDPLLWLPCGRSHPIPLAKLVQRRGDIWEVDPWFQPPAVRQ